MGYTVKQIISSAVSLLGLDGKFDLTDENDADTKFFLHLLAMVADGVAYRLPLSAEEVVTADDKGKIAYSVFSERFVKLQSAKDRLGRLVLPHVGTTGLLTEPCVSLSIRYVYLPAPFGLDDTLPFTERECTESVFVYALCSEYCFAEGLLDESERWRNRYAQEFYPAEKQRAEFIRAREWL